MNLNSLQLIGLAMVVFAFGAQIFIPGAIVYYSTGTPAMQYYPQNTTPSSPQYVDAGATVSCDAVLSGIQPAEVQSATVQISQWSGSAWATIGTYQLTLYQQLITYIEYRYNYQVGNQGILYALSYLIQTTDVGSFTGIGYVQTASLTGYFSINGVTATSTSAIRVTNPSLSITYTITSSGVTTSSLSANVKLMNGTTQLQTVNLSVLNSTTLSGTCVLSGPGTYTLNGFITYGGQTTQQMSIVSVFGDGGGSVLSQMSFSDFYLIIGVFGVLFIVIGARKKKKADTT